MLIHPPTCSFTVCCISVEVECGRPQEVINHTWLIPDISIVPTVCVALSAVNNHRFHFWLTLYTVIRWKRLCAWKGQVPLQQMRPTQGNFPVLLRAAPSMSPSQFHRSCSSLLYFRTASAVQSRLCLCTFGRREDHWSTGTDMV